MMKNIENTTRVRTNGIQHQRLNTDFNADEISKLQSILINLNLWSKDIIDSFPARVQIPATSTTSSASQGAQDIPTSSTNAGKQGSEQRIQAGQKRRHQSSSTSNKVHKP